MSTTNWRLIKFGVQTAEGYAVPDSAILVQDCESALDEFQSYIEWLYGEHDIKWLDDRSVFIPHEGTTYHYYDSLELDGDQANTLIKLMDVPSKGANGW